MTATPIVITTAGYASTCPNCRGRIGVGTAISHPASGGAFQCRFCTEQSLRPLLAVGDPLQEALNELIVEYQAEDLAGLPLRPAVLRPISGHHVTWVFPQEDQPVDRVVAMVEPATDVLRLIYFLPFERLHLDDEEAA